MLGCLVLSIPARAEVTAGAALQDRPNFLFILIDDLGWRDTGCYGSTFYETPYIDSLASQGMRFTDAYAAAPLCSPTRASIMTGKYPARLHLTQVIGHRFERRPPNAKLLSAEFEDQLALGEITLAESLKSAGYVSGHIGKWHLGEPPYYPEKQGFDVNIGGAEGGMPRSYFYPTWKDNVPLEGREGDYLTDRLTDEAERFIRENQHRPFFLHLAHYAVHIPLEAREAVSARYRGKIKPGQAQNDPVYAAMVESVDQSVGRLLQLLDELDLSSRTVVIFVSDNGGLAKPGYRQPTPPTSNEPLRGGKGQLYEGGVRVPLIVRWPGKIDAASVCATPVSTIDFFPTINEMAGVQGPRVDGLSILPLLTGTGKLDRDELYWHFPHYGGRDSMPSSAIRKGDYKLLEYFHDNHAELYDLRKDLGESHDLAQEMPQLARELRHQLEAWRKSVDAWMPRPNLKFDPTKPVDLW